MRFRRPLDEEPELNLIPLIDVLLIVLIFLAVSTTYSRFAELKIQLPSADAMQPAQPPVIINVAVTADGRYVIEKNVLPSTDPAVLSEALTKVAQGREAPLLVISADAQASHQSVVTVMEAARRAGLVRISFATQRTSPSRP